MKRFLSVLSCAIVLTLAGCASSLPTPTEKAPGFLPDYSILTPVTNAPKGTKIYNYVAPGVKRSDYQAVIVEPVALYQNATTKGIAANQVNGARDALQAGIQQVVSQQMPLTNAAGPGVAQLDVAITGAVVDGQSFKVRNLIPVSAAIFMASKMTGLDKKTPAMMVELKFTDSVTHKLLRETVTIITGDHFRLNSTTSDAFSDMAQQWVVDALKYSAAQAQ